MQKRKKVNVNPPRVKWPLFCSDCLHNMWSNVFVPTIYRWFVHGCLTVSAVNNNYFWQALSECYLLLATSKNHIFIIVEQTKRFFLFGCFFFREICFFIARLQQLNVLVLKLRSNFHRMLIIFNVFFLVKKDAERRKVMAVYFCTR